MRSRVGLLDWQGTSDLSKVGAQRSENFRRPGTVIHWFQFLELSPRAATAQW